MKPILAEMLLKRIASSTGIGLETVGEVKYVNDCDGAGLLIKCDPNAMKDGDNWGTVFLPIDYETALWLCKPGTSATKELSLKMLCLELEKGVKSAIATKKKLPVPLPPAAALEVLKAALGKEVKAKTLAKKIDTPWMKGKAFVGDPTEGVTEKFAKMIAGQSDKLALKAFDSPKGSVSGSSTIFKFTPKDQAGNEMTVEIPDAKIVPISGNFELQSEGSPADTGSDTGKSKKGKGKKMTYTPVSVGVSKTGKPTPLSLTTRLYAPVLGTSPGSRYLLVAASEKVRVAMRWVGSSIAIRVESPDAGYGPTLTKNGFSKKDGGHWSLHVSNADPLLLWKSIGSILFGIGVEWGTDYPLRARCEGGGK